MKDWADVSSSHQYNSCVQTSGLVSTFAGVVRILCRVILTALLVIEDAFFSVCFHTLAVENYMYRWQNRRTNRIFKNRESVLCFTLLLLLRPLVLQNHTGTQVSPAFHVLMKPGKARDAKTFIFELLCFTSVNWPNVSTKGHKLGNVQCLLELLFLSALLGNVQCLLELLFMSALVCTSGHRGVHQIFVQQTQFFCDLSRQRPKMCFVCLFFV